MLGIVYNTNSKELGLPPYYYRYKSCNECSNNVSSLLDNNINANTFGIYSSLNTENKTPLKTYQKPILTYQNVCWNQMSDRPVPSIQKAFVPTGNNTSLNRKHTSVTSSRPGCQTPGGIGCDIKHNSYERYLNRIKGKKRK